MTGDSETHRLRALAAAAARRVTAKKQALVDVTEARPFKQRREGAAPIAKPEESRQENLAWYAAARAAEAAARAANGPGVEEPYTVMEVPDNLIGLLIGKHGAGIKQLQVETGSVLCVGKLALEGIRKVCITGSAESQAAAKSSIEAFLLAQEIRTKSPAAVDVVEIPAKFCGRVVGRNGMVIRQVKDACSVTAVLNDAEPNVVTRRLELKGPAEGVRMAREQVELMVLDLYRRERIYNAPLESKYGDKLAAQAAEQAQAAQMAAQVAAASQPVALVKEVMLPWAELYAGSLDCIELFQTFRSREEEVAPGLD